MANPLSSLSGGLKQAGDEAAENARSIGMKTQMVKDLDAQTAAMKAPPAPKQMPANGPSSPADRMNSGARAKYGRGNGEKRIDTSDMTKPLGSFKKGGKVKKTGVYKLHAKEQVMNAKQTAKADKMGGMAAVLAGKK